MITQQLSGNWVMRNRKDTQIIPATVPGSVYGDLPKAGQMEDPFWKDNEIGIPADGERHTAGLLDPQDRSSYDNDGSHQRSVGRALCNLCKRGKHLCDGCGLHSGRSSAWPRDGADNAKTAGESRVCQLQLHSCVGRRVLSGRLVL